MKVKQNSFYNFSVALFLYATLIVDLYRKIGGSSVELVRNLFYIITFGLILIDIIKSKRTIKIFIIGFLVSLFFLISSQINFGHNSIYISTWILFISRLLPAYYIGRYTENWEEVSKYVSNLSWLALLYALIAIITPYDGMSNAYATIGTNLVFVSFIIIRYAIKNNIYIYIGISLICFAAVLFLGTRAIFVGTLLSIVFVIIFFINNQSKAHKILLWTVVILILLVVVSSFSTIIEALIDYFPNSRTLKILNAGDMLNDSNRSDGFYSELINSLLTHPFKIHGFLGDRIYLAGPYATNDVILSSFSHNVILELCMNFGLMPGLLMSLYFLFILIKSLVKSLKNNKINNYLFVMVLGCSFVDMMISLSYLGAYQMWLLFGLAYKIIKTKV